uniref:Uncharacterized protein n=1 Tax=Arundo donax TaxID=35708 RepID=A0A0A9HJ44_ARUDO
MQGILSTRAGVGQLVVIIVELASNSAMA